ncbi:MFS general substrate transporter [Punctularia strigosozonata HHB-11173 SS5]|uniref:MFS general substrate transporter n=1 Tax=Punctularia strigosozonata (strain HHB-11173) TaxID=741275 RepID=UPI0004416B09|nr:MFS general substrate transporter [Punctularia strigosozonata HHB-11173 SS5]EIN08338.1 MFS general substrate transporter [Punctularia strigosozonata HHB-11173 SS5]
MSINEKERIESPVMVEDTEKGKPSRSSAETDEVDTSFTEEEEKHLVRKIDARILPIACAMYLFAFLDRGNLGNARLQGLPQDTLGGDPTGVKFDWVNSAFYFSYILCQVPASIAAKVISPQVWIASAAIGWGICSTLMSTSFNFGSVLVARVAVGVFEAAFGPGIPLYFSLFYTKTEIGLRLAYWFGFGAVAGAFGGLIAFGVQHAHTAIHNWRLLFIIEGIPAVICGVIALLFFPDRPERTKFFNEKERRLAIARMNRGTSGDIGLGVNKKHIIAAFKDWRIYTGGVIYFGLNTALASISAFLPTIIKTLGFTNAIAQLLTVPPYAVAAIVLTLLSWCSDRLQTRGPFLMGSTALSGIGYLLLLVIPHNVGVRYFAVFCITTGTYTAIGLMLSWFAHNLGSESKKATGIPMFMAIGQCGSVLGSHLYPATEGPRYIKGFGVSCGLLFFATLCSFVLHVSYRMANAHRDREYGRPESGKRVDTSELADEASDFRYVP